MIEKLGRRALPVQLDVSSEDQVNEGVRRVLSEFGKIDILCSNAGIFMTKPVAVPAGDKIAGWELSGDNSDKPIELADWRRVLDTNLTAALLFARAAGPHMMKQKKGKVVITSSTASFEGQNFLSAYCVSKALFGVGTVQHHGERHRPGDDSNRHDQTLRGGPRDHQPFDQPGSARKAG
jgi:3-hydroxybutyrate dehydrogenase